MKMWFTSSELLGVPGLPGTDRSIRRLAAREEWTKRIRSGRGAVPEFHVDSLPREARAALAARDLAEGAPAAPVTPADPRDALAVLRAAGTAGRRANARAEVLGLFETFRASAGLPVVEASVAFAALYNAGNVAVAPETRAAVPHLGEATLRKWRRMAAVEGAARLAGKYGNRKGAGKIDRDPEVRDLLVGILAHRPHVSAKQVMRDLRARFKDSPERVPSYDMVKRFLTAWKRDNESVFLAHRDPDAWKSRRRVAFGSANEKIARLNQLWELDSTSADVMLADGRYAVIACVDVFSRRAMALVTRTSRSAAILSLLRRACLAWGVPEAVKTDNGKDYVSAHMERALRDLQVEHFTCTPFSPEQKPHVERFIGTITHGLFEQLPGYIGHSVAERKAIEARRSFAERFGGAELFSGALPMDAAALQAACDAWIEGVYERESHGGLNGRSPFQVAASYAGALRRVENERAMDVLLAEAPGTHGVRTVRKKGIAVEGTHFIAPELGAWDNKKVHVRLDAADMGRIYVFDAETNDFICVAEAPERTGADRREIAAKARELQRAIVKDGVKELRATARRVKAHNLLEEGLAAARADAGRVAAFPRPGEAHDTPALRAAAEAVGPRKADPDVISADTMSEEDRARAAAEFARIQAAAEGKAAPDNVVPLRGEAPAMAADPTLPRSGERPELMTDSEYLRWCLAHPGALTGAQWDEARELLNSWGMRAACGLDSVEAGLQRLGPRPAERNSGGVR